MNTTGENGKSLRSDMAQLLLGTVYSCLLILALLTAHEIIERMRIK